MDPSCTTYATLLFMIIGFSVACLWRSSGIDVKQTASLLVNASDKSLRQIPHTMFGISFEVSFVTFAQCVSFCLWSQNNRNVLQEINHSGAGGLWGELVNNRGSSEFSLLSNMFGNFLVLDFQIMNSHSFNIYMHSGFEAGGENTPSNFSPWIILGNESLLYVSTDRSSCFDRNRVALQMEVLCDIRGDNICPVQGVGIYNPGFWGMVTK